MISFITSGNSFSKTETSRTQQSQSSFFLNRFQSSSSPSRSETESQKKLQGKPAPRSNPVENCSSKPQTVEINISLGGNRFATQSLFNLQNMLSRQLQNFSIRTGNTIEIHIPQIAICKGDFSITIDTSEGFGGKPGKPEKPDGQPQEQFAKPEAHETISRLAPADEAAKTGELSGADRPAPRDISNAVAAQNGQVTKNDNNASDLLWSWGQFIDHDMVLTKEGEESANISVPRGDPGLDPTGTGRTFLPFKRSEGITDENGIRQQINEQTPLIDASMVYGATDEETSELRSYNGGEMKIGDDGFLLDDPDTMVLAGDKRAAEQPGLLSLHTLFVREHNRQAKQIAAENPLMSDERIFQQARKSVAAQIQAITYNEFLPVLLGDQNANPDNFQIDPKTNDGKVSNEFATAAYRLGHTLVSETVAIKQADGSLKQATLDEVFFKPDFTKETGIGSILSGQSEQTSEKVDNKIVDGLRNRLFGPPGSGAPGLDLASLNIQRGRDHNLPSYNDMRDALGLQRIESFDNPIFQEGVGEQLASVYSSPDDMDLWAGGLAENPSGDSMLGETFTKIVAEQFAKTAQADKDFYSRSMSAEDQDLLSNLTLADVIRANSDSANMDDTAFIVD
jgi:hypothetical protein